MDVLHARCAGLDVHRDSVVACARLVGADGTAYEVATFGTMAADLERLAAWLAARGVTQVAMEATGVYWKPVWAALAAKVELILANAAHVKNLPGRKTDVNDATWLADRLAHGLIRASFVPGQPIQALRDLTRTRRQLTREKAAATLDLRRQPMAHVRTRAWQQDQQHFGPLIAPASGFVFRRP